MSRNRTKNTSHSYLRSAERCGWDKRLAKRKMALASRYGKSWENIESIEIREYLKEKSISTHRRVKYYEGYIFVFCSTSTRCITVYPYERRNNGTSTTN